MRALQFAQDRLATGGWRSIQRPLPLTILMWFCALFAIGALIGVGAVGAGFGEPSMGGMFVSRELWLQVAAPLLSATAILMLLTSVGLRWHQPWARWTCMCIWALIAATGLAAGLAETIPWRLAQQAAINSCAFGAFFAWLLFWYGGSVLYFYRVRQARGGSFSRR